MFIQRIPPSAARTGRRLRGSVRGRPGCGANAAADSGRRRRARGLCDHARAPCPVTYYGGSYAGGAPGLNATSGRDDLYAQAVRQVRNLGLRDLFEACEYGLRVVEMSARVAAEVAAAYNLAPGMA